MGKRRKFYCKNKAGPLGNAAFYQGDRNPAWRPIFSLSSRQAL